LYGAAPPEAVAKTLPLHAPLQVMFVSLNTRLIAGGCLIVSVAVLVHPSESLQVIVYTPAGNPFAVLPVPPDGDHKKV
jgi:hypothetical protein